MIETLLLFDLTFRTPVASEEPLEKQHKKTADLFPSDVSLRSPGRPTTAKQTYTDIAKGAVGQSDWITGCELSCFGGEERALCGGCRAQLPGCFLQLRGALLRAVDEPTRGAQACVSVRGATLTTAGGRGKKSPSRPLQRQRSHAAAVSCAVLLAGPELGWWRGGGGAG